VTRQRMYLETIEDVLSQSNKVIMDKDQSSGVVPYLALPELQQRRNQAATQPTTGAAQQ
jgi:membrane protease subunit HflK